MRKLTHIFFTLLLICCFTTSAQALELDTAKAQGLVGEMENGYLGSPKPNPSSEVKALLLDINGKRKQHYMALAKKVEQPLTTIEELAGKKAIEKTQAGYYVQLGGNWKKK